MSPLERYNAEYEAVVRELLARIVAPRMSEFEGVWESANEVCDQYGLGGGSDQSMLKAA